MADDLDPRLEASLRAALHHEADSVPLLIRSDDIERARRRRGGKRLALPASLLAAAAVIAVVVVVGGAWRANQAIIAMSPSPSPMPSLAIGDDLDTDAALEESLLRLFPGLPIVARGEHLDAGGATGPVAIEVGRVPAFRTLHARYDCAGGAIRIAVMDGDAETFAADAACGTEQRAVIDSIGSPGADNRIVVTADAAVRWRIVVSADPVACVALSGDATDRSLILRSLERPMPIDNVATLAWHTVGGATVSGSEQAMPAVGRPVAASAVEGVTIDPAPHCFDLDRMDAGVVSRADYEAARASGTRPPFRSHSLEWRPDSPGVTVRTLPTGDQVIWFRAAWQREDGKEDTDTWLIPVSATGPASTTLMPYEDLAIYAASTVELLRAEHKAVEGPTQTIAGSVGDAWNLEFAVACDIGEVVITFRGAGVTYPSASSFGCDGGAGSIVTASPVPQGTATEVLVDATAGTSWRLIAYDHVSDLKTPIEALPLPPARADQASEGVFVGVLSPATGSGYAVEVYPVAAGTTFEVVYACEGSGSFQVMVDGTTKDAACTASGSLAFTPAGFGPSTMALTSDHAVRVNLELRSTAP